MSFEKRWKDSDHSGQVHDWLVIFGIICGEVDALLPCSGIVAWHAMCRATLGTMGTDTWTALMRIQAAFTTNIQRPDAIRSDVHQMIHRAYPLTGQRAEEIIDIYWWLRLWRDEGDPEDAGPAYSVLVSEWDHIMDDAERWAVDAPDHQTADDVWVWIQTQVVARCPSLVW